MPGLWRAIAIWRAWSAGPFSKARAQRRAAGGPRLARARQHRRADRALRRAPRATSAARCCERALASRAAARLSGWRCSMIASTSSCSASARPEEQQLPAGRRAAGGAARRAGGRHQRCALSPAPMDFDAHEARVCIQEGTLLADPARPRRYTPQQYLRSAGGNGRAVRGSARGAHQHGGDRAPLQSALTLGQARLPDYPVPAGTTPTRVPARRRRRLGMASRSHAGSRGAGALSRHGSRRSSMSSARWASPATS